MRVILAQNVEQAVAFVRKHNIHPRDYIIVHGRSSLEGLRFRYEDVIRIPGWSQRPDIEEIEDTILNTHVVYSPRK